MEKITNSNSNTMSAGAQEIQNKTEAAGTKLIFKRVKRSTTTASPTTNDSKRPRDAENDESDVNTQKPAKCARLTKPAVPTASKPDTVARQVPNNNNAKVNSSKRQSIICDIAISDAGKRVAAEDHRKNIQAEYESAKARSKDFYLSPVEQLKGGLRAAKLEKELLQAKRIDVLGSKFVGKWEKDYRGCLKKVYHQEQSTPASRGWLKPKPARKSEEEKQLLERLTKGKSSKGSESIPKHVREDIAAEARKARRANYAKKRQNDPTEYQGNMGGPRK